MLARHFILIVGVALFAAVLTPSLGGAGGQATEPPPPTGGYNPDREGMPRSPDPFPATTPMLPQTASSVPLIGELGAVALVFASGLYFWRRRPARF